MIDYTLTIDEVEYKFQLAESWDDVDVETFMKIHNLENTNQIQLMIDILNIFSDIDKDIIEMIDYKIFNDIISSLNFIKDKIDSQVKDKITINDEDYYIKKDFTKMTMGEVVSIETLTERTGGDLVKAMPELLCIFLRKKKESGKLEEFKNEHLERVDLFKKIKITDVYNLFFYTILSQK